MKALIARIDIEIRHINAHQAIKATPSSAYCYPFLLNAFHAIVGTQAISLPPLAIASATFILVVAFIVPLLGIALAYRPTPIPVQDASPMPALCRQRSMSFSALSSS